MKSLFFLFIYLIFTGRANAALEVHLDIDKERSSGVGISLSFFNKTKETICLNGSILGLNGVFHTNPFSIQRDGERIRFLRPMDIRTEEDKLGLTLFPGRKIVVSLNLADEYDFSKPGLYQITYQTWNIAKCGDTNSGIEIKSNTISFKKNGS